MPGKVIIQSYNPENFAIQCSKKQDYKLFYETEIELRKQLKYPPFCDIILIRFNGEDENKIKRISQNIFSHLEKTLDHEKFKVFKPMPAPIDKIQNKYRWRMIIKGNMDENANEIFNNMLKTIYEKDIKDFSVTVEVNPNNMN